MSSKFHKNNLARTIASSLTFKIISTYKLKDISTYCGKELFKRLCNRPNIQQYSRKNVKITIGTCVSKNCQISSMKRSFEFTKTEQKVFIKAKKLPFYEEVSCGQRDQVPKHFLNFQRNRKLRLVHLLKTDAKNLKLLKLKL